MSAADEPSRDETRQAIVEAATKGWRAPRRPRRPRHVQEKDSAWDRFLSVKDACRILAELLGEYGPESIMAGALDDASRARAVAVISMGYRHLHELMDHIVRAGANAGDDAIFQQRNPRPTGDHPKPTGPATDAIDPTEAEIAADRGKSRPT